jgi:hypothetical protein
MRARVIFCGIVFISLLGCEPQKRSIDITPHLRWSLVDSENSKITSDDGGLLLRGGVLVIICEFGVLIGNGEESYYVNMKDGRVSRSYSLNEIKVRGISFDAISAMGIYDRTTRLLFQKEMDGVRERISKLNK